MNKLLLTLLIALPFFGLSQSKHKGKNGVTVVDASTQSIFGAAPGYYVVFKNNGKKTVDGIRWKATFTNNFGEVLGVRDGKWESGNFISPIESGETTEDIETNWVKGALKIKIEITQVSFVD